MSRKAGHPKFGLRLGVICAGMGFCALHGQAGQPIDLEAAIELALRQNASLRIAALQLDQSRLAGESARVRFATQWKPEGGWRITDDSDQRYAALSAVKETVWGTAFEVEGRVEQRLYDALADYHRDRVRVRLTQPLLRQFGELVNREPLRSAERRVLAAEREWELRKADIVIQVLETYERLFLLQQQMRFDEVRVRRLERLVRLTEAKEKQGRASRVDVLRVQLQYGEAQSRLFEMREQLTSAAADLSELLGLSSDIVLEAVRAPVPELEIPEYSEALDLAMANRLDYAQVLQDCEDAARGVRIARRNLLPDLKVIAEYERFGEGETAQAARNLEKDAWLVALTLDPTDVLRRDERIKLRQAEINEATAREIVAQAGRALERQVQQGLAAHARARAELPLAERNYAIAESRMRLAQRMFEIGRGDNFSVTDAEQALLQAQNRLLSAQAEAVVTSYRLLRTLGLLLDSPDYLKAGEKEADRLGRGMIVGESAARADTLERK